MRIVSSPLEETPDRAEVAGTGQEGNPWSAPLGDVRLGFSLASYAFPGKILTPTTEQIHLILACPEIQ
jgi:hypothetical protein